MPDAVPGTKDTMTNEKEKVAVLMVLIFQLEACFTYLDKII